GLGRGLPLRADWRGAVLMMHRVRPAGTGAFRPNRHLEITPGFLDDVLERLSQMRIPVVCLEEAADRLARGCTDRFAALTFDDGYRDNLVHAAPVMRRHGVPFTVFVATGMVDASANAWWMTLEEIVAAATTTDARPAGCGLLDTRDAKRKTAAFDTLVRAMWRFDEPGRDRAIREMADRH
ncbi:MAG: polysaccharide deacetylase family protein, partial [Thermoleophilia bacterium]|nr:polysaccharide deacetylase family protein [Thermoleophilia bacterium]